VHVVLPWRCLDLLKLVYSIQQSTASTAVSALSCTEHMQCNATLHKLASHCYCENSSTSVHSGIKASISKKTATARSRMLNDLRILLRHCNARCKSRYKMVDDCVEVCKLTS
jgi:hypothetical protein